MPDDQVARLLRDALDGAARQPALRGEIARNEFLHAVDDVLALTNETARLHGVQPALMVLHAALAVAFSKLKDIEQFQHLAAQFEDHFAHIMTTMEKAYGWFEPR